MKGLFEIILITVILVLIVVFALWKGGAIEGKVLIETDKAEYQGGDTLAVRIKNRLGARIAFSSCYPYYFERKNGEWVGYEYEDCQKPNTSESFIESGQEKTFEIKMDGVPPGVHRIALPFCVNCYEGEVFDEDERSYSNEFNLNYKVND